MYLFLCNHIVNNLHKPRKTVDFKEMCKFCDKIKKIKKGVEKGGKVVYN